MVLIIDSHVAESEVALNVAKLMVAAARTAPKARGEDKIRTAIVTGDDKEKLARAMEKANRARDAGNVHESDAVVLIGVELGKPDGEWIEFRAKLIDLGIALGSAAKIASEMNVDNRIMRSVGTVAMDIGMLKADEVHGIPVSIRGKNIYFDRKT